MINITINGNIHFSVNELTSLTIEAEATDVCTVAGSIDTPKTDMAEEDWLEVMGREFNAEFGKCQGCTCAEKCIDCSLSNAERESVYCPAEEHMVETIEEPTVDEFVVEPDGQVKLVLPRCLDCEYKKPFCSDCDEYESAGACTYMGNNEADLGCAGWVKEDYCFNEDYFREFIRCIDCPNSSTCREGTDYNDYVEVTDYLRSKGKNIAACLEDGDIDICDDSFDEVTTESVPVNESAFDQLLLGLRAAAVKLREALENR